MTPSALVRLRAIAAGSSVVRFLISGGLNTAVTYALYLVLLQFLNYRIAYTIAYVAGIVLAFVVNRTFVFRSHRGWRSVVLFPFVYLVQYLAGLTIAVVWIEYFRFPQELAPLAAIVVTLPLTFVLSRAVFGRRRRI